MAGCPVITTKIFEFKYYCNVCTSPNYGSVEDTFEPNIMEQLHYLARVKS